MKMLDVSEYGVMEMGDNIAEINGGSWLSEKVAEVVHYLKCDCHWGGRNDIDDSTILGPNAIHYQ
ncbi:MAG: hypothetical protein QM669_00480 [Siphonobacter sp.]